MERTLMFSSIHTFSVACSARFTSCTNRRCLSGRKAGEEDEEEVRVPRTAGEEEDVPLRTGEKVAAWPPLLPKEGMAAAAADVAASIASCAASIAMFASC